MKTSIFMCALLAVCLTSCQGQNDTKGPLNLNIWSFIDEKYLGVTRANIVHGGLEYQMTIPYHELAMQDIRIGDACVFALSKTYPEKWVKEAEVGECRTKDSPRAAIFCRAKKLFSSDTMSLKKDLDLYLFF